MADSYEDITAFSDGLRNILILILIATILYIPLGNSRVSQDAASCEGKCDRCPLCLLYCKANAATITLETWLKTMMEYARVTVYNLKIEMYRTLKSIDGLELCSIICKKQKEHKQLSNQKEEKLCSSLDCPKRNKCRRCNNVK